MLNIPNTVKALFKADESRKNFRVQFPNGEHADLTNSDVVQETVRFTESICSQDAFRFGTIEASVLEFETVGVPNLYGATIEASIEIDLSSLTAGQLQDIKDDPGDGVYVAEADSDIGYAYYRISYGQFVVHECPRDHQQLAHRSFTCYSPLIDKPPAEVVKNRSQVRMPFVSQGENFSGAVYTPNCLWLFFSNNLFPLLNYMTVADTRNWTDFGANLTTSGTVDLESASGKQVIYNLTYKKYVVDYDAGNGILYNSALHNVRLGDMPLSPYLSDLAGLSGVSESVIRNSLAVLEPHVIFDDYDITDPTMWYMLRKAEERIYPYTNSSARPCIIFPVSYTLTYQENGTTVDTLSYSPGSGLATYPSVQRYSPGLYVQFWPQLLLQCSQLETEVPDPNFGTIPLGVLSEDYSFIDMAQAWLEAQGYFTRPSRLPPALRASEWEILDISKANPESIIPGDYSVCWWDDYNIDRLGTIFYADHGTAAVHYIAEGGESAYNMTDNFIFNNMAPSNSYPVSFWVYYFLGQKFRYGGELALLYYPVDMEMQAWPWIQAGDYIEVETEDGQTVGTYAMRIETTGIQNLRAVINSETGEIREGT